MNEVKTAWIKALDESAEALGKVLAIEEPAHPFDVEGIRANLSDGNAVAKAKLNDFVEIFRSTAEGLRNGSIRLRPTDAQNALDGLDIIVATLDSANRNEIFRAAVLRTLNPQREAIEKHAVRLGDTWHFREEDCDTTPPFPPPPPDPNSRVK